MSKKPQSKEDSNKRQLPIMDLQDSHDVDGTGASAQSNAIDGEIVRIVSIDNALRIAIGLNPTALASSILINALGEIWLPITIGHKVAIFGGRANITTAGI